MLDAHNFLKRIIKPFYMKLYFGGADPPAVVPVNAAGRDANEATAAAKAAQLEREKLAKERGQAATILGGEQMQTKTTGKPTLLSGLS